ncbi:uncharacterized protein LOC144571637 isoform X2 [Carex rostrata]
MGSRLFQNGIPVEGEADDDVLATPFTQEMFLNGFNLEPFVNELARIRHSMKCLQQKHEVKKSKLWPQYEQEIESTRRKYDLFLKIEDATFKKDKAFLEELRQKVERGISVDKEFRARFLQTMEADALHEGLMPGHLNNSILGTVPPKDQIEGLKMVSILDPASPKGVVEQLNSSSILVPEPGTNLRSDNVGHTGIGT